MTRILLAALALGFTGCAAVKVAQREGCWVRTTKVFGNVREELGPCVKPPPKWADDRVTRIVQECVAQDDHRWESQALAAWSRGEPLPRPPAPDGVLHACMQESARAAVEENERLAAQLADLKTERDRLAARTDDDRKHLLESHDRLAADLGEAARKAQAPATATATASGEGRSEGAATPTPVTVVAAAPAQPCTGAPTLAAGTARAARRARDARPAPRAAPGGCPPVPAAAAAKPDAPPRGAQDRAVNDAASPQPAAAAAR